MAFRWMDSWGAVDTATLPEKYWDVGSNTTIHATNGRRGGPCLAAMNWAGGVRPGPLGASGSIFIAGAAFYFTGFSAGGGGAIFSIFAPDGTTAQTSLVVNASGALEARRGAYNGTLLGSPSTNVLLVNTWYWIEVKILIDGANGTVEARVNGSKTGWLDLSSQNTRGHASLTTWNHIRILVTGVATGGSWRCSDWYVLDGSGGVNDDFWGEIRADAHFPNFAGATAGWTSSGGGGSLYTNVDDPAPNTSDDNRTATLNAIDSFALEDHKNVGADPKAVQVSTYLTKADIGACGVAPLLRSGGTDYPHATITYPSFGSWGYTERAYDTNPSGAAWTEAAFNALEAGYKKAA